MLFQGGVRKYHLANSLFAGNEHLYASGLGPAVDFRPLEKSVLDLPPASRILEQAVALEMNQLWRDYVHVAAGKPGSEVGAGLFGK